MELLERLALTPLPQQLPLAEALIGLLTLLVLAFGGVLLVSAACALVTQGWRRPVAQRLIDLVAAAPANWFIFGLLPLAALLFLFGQTLRGADVAIGLYLLRVGILFVLAFVLLAAYQRTLRPLFGLPGLLLLLGGSFHLLATLTFLIYPEKWPLMPLPVPFLFSIQAVLQFKLFVTCALVLTGALILVAYFRWPERPAFDDEDDAVRVQRFGFGLALAGALAMAPLLIWDLYAAPLQALAPDVFRAAAVMLALLLVAALLAAAMMRHQHARYGGLLLALALGLLGLFTYQGRAMHHHAAREVLTRVADEAGEEYDLLVSAQEEQYQAGPPDAQLGEEIFDQKCTSCHAFDRVVVGPPYNETVPKYANDPIALAEYILAPQRINPEYPPMPDQGLKPREARSAALFLLRQVVGDIEASAFTGEEGGAQ